MFRALTQAPYSLCLAGGTTEWDQAPSRCILNAAGPAAADPTPTDTHPPAVMQHSSEPPLPLEGADAPPTVSLDEYLAGSRQKAVAPTAQSGGEGGAGSYWGPVDVASRTGTVRLPANCFVVCTACGARHSQIDPGCADCGEAIGVARREWSRIGSVWADPAEWLPSELWLRCVSITPHLLPSFPPTPLDATLQEFTLEHKH